MKRIASHLFYGLRSSFASLKSLIRRKDYFFLVFGLLSFVWLFFLVVVSAKPFNYIANSVFVLLFVLSFVFAFLRKKIGFEPFVLFWFSFIIISFVINMINGYHGLTSYASCLVPLTMFVFVRSCDSEERNAFLRIIYLVFLIFLFWFFIRYFKGYVIEGLGIHALLDNYFGNLDGVSNYLAMSFLLSLFFILKKDYLAAPIAVLALLCTLWTQRRTAAVFLIIFLILFLYKLLAKHHVVFYLSVIGVFVVILLALFFSDTLQSILSRLIDSDDGSANMRLLMIIKGFYFGLTDLFNSFGFNMQTSFVYVANHDFFGDVAFSYSGFVALAFTIISFAWGINGLRDKSEFNFLTNSLFFIILLLFFLGSILQNRIILMFIGLFYGFIEKNKQKETNSSVSCLTINC
ncbi:MAG: hypothetical protein LKG11_05190 [Bacilli bacterium]|nr:hypothetical protein [Bacilli bacterium]